MKPVLTPLEEIEERRLQTALFTGVLLATQDLLKAWAECNTQLEKLSSDSDLDELEVIKLSMIEKIYFYRVTHAWDTGDSPVFACNLDIFLCKIVTCMSYGATFRVHL